MSVDAIQKEIVRRICFLDYAPGCQLKEAELAREFGVSRTPVRDAISRIKHLGLVDTRNGVGTVVVRLTKDQIRDVYDMRLNLAQLIGSMSPRPVTAHDIQQINDLLNSAVELEQVFDARLYVALNDRLQNLIAGLIGNEMLRAFWLHAYVQAASTWYRVAALAGQEVAGAFVQELQGVREALLQGDMVALGLVQRIHIGYGYQRIIQHASADVGAGSAVSPHGSAS
ncbi:GntR family transcriptional regulator [Coralliovum pocilloporae]|uniref:GntR family transcriptional regulator n=1 Tax=Coralliovum pocilloporae TaxID=3066369 RepID=UPI00330708BF